MLRRLGNAPLGRLSNVRHDDGVARGQRLEAFQVVGQPIYQFVLRTDGSVLCYGYNNGYHLFYLQFDNLQYTIYFSI